MSGCARYDVRTRMQRRHLYLTCASVPMVRIVAGREGVRERYRQIALM